jgi:hypothetical protein
LGVTIVTVSLLLSCQDSHTIESEVNQTTLSETHLGDVSHLKKEFAVALSKVLSESKEVRTLIKNEALKKIDYDNDVLYLMIKDRILSDGYTIRDALLRYISEDIITQIEEEIPTLTIFVPTLPNDIFSATLWDIDEDIPCVAVRTSADESTPIYNYLGEETLCSAIEIPAYPVVVVKTNERIIVNESSTRNGVLNGTNLRFSDEIFNNLSPAHDSNTGHINDDTTPLTRGSSLRNQDDPLPKVPQKVLDAYNIYSNNKGWQRDYIYYGLTPTNTAGPLDNNYKEYLVGFEMIGNADVNLNKISDQSSDPKRTKDMSYTRASKYWTDGEFEFRGNL